MPCSLQPTWCRATTCCARQQRSLFSWRAARDCAEQKKKPSGLLPEQLPQCVFLARPRGEAPAGAVPFDSAVSDELFERCLDGVHSEFLEAVLIDVALNLPQAGTRSAYRLKRFEYPASDRHARLLHGRTGQKA